MPRHALGLLLAMAVGLAPALCNADLYRWVDDLGVTHYATDRDTIPRRFRGDAQVIAASPAPLAAPRAAPAPSEATPVLPLPSVDTPAAAPETPEASPVLPLPSVDAPAAAPATPEATPVLPLPSAEIPAAAPATELTPPTPPVFPGPPTMAAIPPEDPRAAEVAALEAQIASDRERLRQMISTKRWDSAELASDPSVREIAERLPRLQAELAALRAETVP